MTYTTTTSRSSSHRALAIHLNRLNYSVSRHWMLLFSIFYGLFIALPFLAPSFMQLGLPSLASSIYTLYSTTCHQLPERSFFLFGPHWTYSLNTIQTLWQNTNQAEVLRQFIGSPSLGWKVAWSDRMVTMFSSVLVFAWAWYPLRKKIKPLSYIGFLLLVFPLILDGSSHSISDQAGIGLGYRDTNAWLVSLTQNTFPASFYAGDAWGSINSILRLATGLLWGLGVVWYTFPIADRYFSAMMAKIEARFARAGLKL